MDITINKDELANILSSTTSFVGATAPKLEKLANYEADLDSSAVAVVEKLASLGLVRVEDKTAAVKELTEGGIAKLAETFDYVISKLSKVDSNSTRNLSMGKQASQSLTQDSPQRELSSDEVFERRLGINR